MPQKSRALWILAILALLAIVCGFAFVGGILPVPIAKPNAMDARDWDNLLMNISWGFIVGGALILVGTSFAWLIRALDKVERDFLDPDSKHKN